MAIQNTDTQERQDALPAAPTNTSPLTPRALLAGIIGSALTCLLVTWAELVISTIKIGYLQLPPVSLVLLIIVVAAVRGISKLLGGRWAFSQTEIVTVYVLSLLAAMVSSHGVAQHLLPLLAAPNYFATSQNSWGSVFSAHLPHWLVPYKPQGLDRQAVTAWYYDGLPRGASLPWLAWAGPLAVWLAFLGLVAFAFLCLTALLRRQWVDNEKLSFPLAQLPLEIIAGDDQGRPFFSKPAVWWGAAIPVVVFGMDWAHQIAPSLPSIPTSLALNDYLTQPPWNQIGYTPLILSFAALGFFFLLPTDVLLSLWFFFLLDRAEQVIGAQYNLPMPHMPTSWLPVFEGYQTIGAYVALTAYLLYLARPHFRKILAESVQKKQSLESQQEILPYRTAFWGLAASLILSCLMLHGMGMSLWLAVLEVGVVVLIISVVMARSTAEGGLLMTETTFQPYDIYQIGGSMHALGATNLTLLAFADHLISHDQRGLLLTGMLDSAFLGDRFHIRRRSLAAVIGIGIVVAVAIAVPLQLYVTYKFGGLSLDSWMMQGSAQMQFKVNQAFGQASDSMDIARVQRPVFFGVGIAVTLGLMLLRSRLAWWPLHPLGYALAGSQSTIEFWFPCLLAWALKCLTLRYGGTRAYQAVRPFFLGMIVGEFGMAVASAVAGVLFHLPSPPFPWI